MEADMVFQCKECGLHYEDKKTAERCQAFCKEHNGCSLEITKLSVERKNAHKESGKDDSK